jgi:hypothetical protein
MRRWMFVGNPNHRMPAMRASQNAARSMSAMRLTQSCKVAMTN